MTHKENNYADLFLEIKLRDSGYRSYGEMVVCVNDKRRQGKLLSFLKHKGFDLVGAAKNNKDTSNDGFWP